MSLFSWPVRIATHIQAGNALLGRACAWLTLFLVLGTACVVVLRYAFGIGATALQEAVMYAHALTFMGTAAWALQRQAHVRVDIFYQNFSARKKALVDTSGHIFLLLPMCLFLGWNSWGYVANSWAIYETSGETGGLGFMYLQKSIILLLVVSLLLQACADLVLLIKQLLTPSAVKDMQHE
ncbi:MAG: TRAP transporter small permease subunit [Pseudomonas sp.]|jgi:TRAP-type mannitol/chloroaromatic compound transport system permease small subunit|nr:TRAP transporter small permease subunit [Pseudomonas sp.]